MKITVNLKPDNFYVYYFISRVQNFSTFTSSLKVLEIDYRVLPPGEFISMSSGHYPSILKVL